MARTLRNAKIDTRSARLKLMRRREPHWTVLSKGYALGYRKGANGGTWIARVRDDAGRLHYGSLGQSDDLADANNLTILSFTQAQEKALQFLRLKATQPLRVTVGTALDDYFAAYSRRGGKALDRMKSSARTHIERQLGPVAIVKLTRKRLEQWHCDIAKSEPAVRGKRGQPAGVRKINLNLDSRKRSATANRVLTILKAALNHARNEGHVSSDAAWDRVRAFREVDLARQRYLSDDETRRLVAACPAHFRKMVMAALLSGCRYGELCRLTCEDFSRDSGTILVRSASPANHAILHYRRKGRAFSRKRRRTWPNSEQIFTRPNGAGWSHSDQQRPIQDAVKAAQLAPITFRGLRHTYASRLAIKAVPLAVIAKQLGHSDTRMVEKHYGHLAPSYVADTIRAAFGTMSIEYASDNAASSAA
jgi:integrase